MHQWGADLFPLLVLSHHYRGFGDRAQGSISRGNSFDFSELELNLVFSFSFKSICCLLSGIPLLHSPEFVLFRDPVMPIKLSMFFMLTYGLCKVTKGVHKLIWTPSQPLTLILPTCRCWSMKNTGCRRAVFKMLSQHPPLFCHSVSYSGWAKMGCKDTPSCYSQTQSFILVM